MGVPDAFWVPLSKLFFPTGNFSYIFFVVSHFPNNNMIFENSGRKQVENQVLRFSIVHDLKLTHSRVNKTMENVGSNHETISKCDILCKCRRTVIRISNNFTNTCLKYTCGSCFYLQSLKGTIIKKVLVKTHGENSFELFSLFINC